MYKNKKIAIVIPAHNEETQIEKVLSTMPDYVDKMIVIDDKSTDKTISKTEDYQKKDPRVHLIIHKENQGVGGAIASGYKWVRDNNEFDIAVVMAGDGQMDPIDLPAILDPVADDLADYSKANRLFTGEAFKIIPKIRYFGNSVLSVLTKISSGYWHIADSQAGYTAINREMLELINWDNMYKQYGQPNDLLVKLNVYEARVKDVHVKPVYNVGEKSGIRIPKVIIPISMLLIRLFFWRLKEKYIIRDFHPLVFFYSLGLSMFMISGVFFIRLLYLWNLRGFVPELSALILFFTFSMGLQVTFFAMWFDMEHNKHLK